MNKFNRDSSLDYDHSLDEKDKIVLSEGYLPTDKIFKIDQYLRMFGFLSQSIEDYLQGNVQGKLKNPSKRMYCFLVLLLFLVMACRNVILVFTSNVWLRNFLGEPKSGRPVDQIELTMAIWSIYGLLLCNLFYKSEKNQLLSWLSPFSIFKGVVSPASMGLNVKMTDEWFRKTKKSMNQSLLFCNIQGLIANVMFALTAYHRFYLKSVPVLANFFWTSITMVWIYYGSALIFISYSYFYSLAAYFILKYRKVNQDIETIISSDPRMKPNERCAMLYRILVDHNKTCSEIHDCNRFWSKYIMQTYFLFIAIICYTTFQTFFTYNNTTVRLFMFSTTVVTGLILTNVSIAASRLTNEAHLSYGRLIRVTFNKYPVELQIQLRMFIQRLSGPTIGFYCLDIFEITYSTYASIIAALGQNFLLVIDFVQSYAQLKEEHYTSSELDISDVFNATFSLNTLVSEEINMIQEKLL
ncbi:Agrin [Sarcoptes scabiei]|nr:Agrin [Sarcoptes scabiei]